MPNTMSRVSRLSRVTACGAAGVLLAAVVTGCGSNDGDGDGDGGSGGKDAARTKDKNPRQSPTQVVRTTNEKTSDAGSARVEVATTVSAKGESETVRGEGVMDFKGGESRMTLGQAGERLEQRVVDQALYQKPPKGDNSLPQGKTWMKVDLERLRASGGTTDSRISDPADSFAYSKFPSDQEVQEVGEERVRGVRTTHYRAAVDIDKLTKGNAEQKKQMREQVGDTLPMDLWIDDKGVLRRHQLTMSIQKPAEGETSGPAKAEVKIAMDFSDFGTEVNVEAPAASDTADVTTKLIEQDRQKA
ncbi:hypothetical protein [Streptomyces alfalfae]|nr:hypothetical protein [Streptomyces alfalfae]